MFQHGVSGDGFRPQIGPFAAGENMRPNLGRRPAGRPSADPGGFGFSFAAARGSAGRGRSRPGSFDGGGSGGPFDRGFGGGRERLFDAGEIKLLILKILSETPTHGYQLIKAMEELFAGEYTPSAGVIYPTLTLLDEEGLLSSTISEKDRKVYSVTPQGFAYMAERKEDLDMLLNRIKQTGKRFERGRSPELMQAFFNLRGAVVARVSRDTVTNEQIQNIVAVINAAAAEIDKI